MQAERVCGARHFRNTYRSPYIPSYKIRLYHQSIQFLGLKISKLLSGLHVCIYMLYARIHASRLLGCRLFRPPSVSAGGAPIWVIVCHVNVVSLGYETFILRTLAPWCAGRSAPKASL